MPAPVTAIYAGLSGLLALILATLVVRARARYRTMLGTGTDPAMERAVRVHANFIEYVPLTLVLLLLAELNGVAHAVLHAAGSILVVSRALHAYGLSRTSGRSAGRFYGTVGTWLVLLGLSLVVLATTALRAG